MIKIKAVYGRGNITVLIDRDNHPYYFGKVYSGSFFGGSDLLKLADGITWKDVTEMKCVSIDKSGKVTGIKNDHDIVSGKTIIDKNLLKCDSIKYCAPFDDVILCHRSDESVVTYDRRDSHSGLTELPGLKKVKKIIVHDKRMFVLDHKNEISILENGIFKTIYHDILNFETVTGHSFVTENVRNVKILQVRNNSGGSIVSPLRTDIYCICEDDTVFTMHGKELSSLTAEFDFHEFSGGYDFIKLIPSGLNAVGIEKNGSITLIGQCNNSIKKLEGFVFDGI